MADRDESPYSVTQRSSSTTVTTPEQSPDRDDDIWISDAEGDHPATSRDGPQRHEMLSDLPTVRRQHMTDGYREGLAVGKAKVIQQGFDDGYPIGVTIALRVGRVLGVLEGCLTDKPQVDRSVQDQRKQLQNTYDQAKKELAMTALMASVDDEMLAAAKDVPTPVERVLKKWEKLVLGTD